MNLAGSLNPCGRNQMLFFLGTQSQLATVKVMSDFAKSILASAGFSAVFSGAIIWLFKSWISERLKNAIAHEYEQKAKAIDFAYDQKLKAIEHGYNEQLEKLRVQLLNESATANTRLKAQLEHDSKTFAYLNALMDETTFRDVCNVIGCHQFYDDDGCKKLLDLEHYGIQIENQFLNTTLRDEFARFHKELDAFTTIVATVFFNVGERRYMLYPELKNSDDDKKRKRYEDARIETRDATFKVLEAFTSFRKQVQQVLYI